MSASVRAFGNRSDLIGAFADVIFDVDPDRDVVDRSLHRSAQRSVQVEITGPYTSEHEKLVATDWPSA